VTVHQGSKEGYAYSALQHMRAGVYTILPWDSIKGEQFLGMLIDSQLVWNYYPAL